jgi:hypothetical protein
MRTLLSHVRWDRLGLTVLSVLLPLLEYMSDNIPAMMYAVLAGVIMYLYFREQDRCLHARQVAIYFAEKTKGKDKDNGNTTTQP